MSIFKKIFGENLEEFILKVLGLITIVVLVYLQIKFSERILPGEECDGPPMGRYTEC